MDIDLPATGSICRLLGRGPTADSRRRLACGVMDKAGWAIDFLDFQPQTYSLVWILRGAGTFSDDRGQTWTLSAGDCFQRWPGRTLSTRIDPGSGFYELFIDLGRDLHEGLAAVGALDPDRPVWSLGLDPQRIRRWTDLRTALAAATTDQLPALCVQAQGLVVEALAPSGPGEDVIARACQHLTDDLAGRDSLQGFCAGLGLDYDAFRKRFRRATGLSPGQYRLRRRLERACALLLDTTRPISGIAHDLGYASPFEFSAQFRRHCGLSPRTYRTSNGGLGDRV